MKKSIATFLFLSVFFLCQLVNATETPEGESGAFLVKSFPDILIITVDTLRADRMSAYREGGVNTPALEELANAGMLFERAYVPIPRTTPAIATMLTGLNPLNHGSREVRMPIKRNLPTIATLLKELGYYSFAVVAQSVIGKNQRLDRGFNEFFEVHGVPHAIPLNKHYEKSLKAVSKHRQLFSWIHYIDPHTPYRPFQHSPTAQEKECHRAFRKVRPIGLLEGNYQGKAEQVKTACESLYHHEIAVLDRGVAEIRKLHAEHRSGRPLFIVFTADHGENFGEDGLYFEHGPSLSPASSRVPLIIAGPGVRKGRSSELFSMEDLLPTLMSHLRLDDKDTPFDGLDLSCLLTDGTKECQKTRKFIHLESASNLNAHNVSTLYSGTAGRFHCFNKGQYSLCKKGRKGESRLYNNQLDPHFKNPLPAPPKAILKELRHAASLWTPEEVRSQSIISKDAELLLLPKEKGGYSEHIFPLMERTGERLKESAAVPARKVHALQKAYQAVKDRGKPTPLQQERDEDALEELRSLGYIDG